MDKQLREDIMKIWHPLLDESTIKQVADRVNSDGPVSQTLAHEMFREMLCKMSLCDYGTSPRVCFPTAELKELLPSLIDKWTQYYKLQWGEDL